MIVDYLLYLLNGDPGAYYTSEDKWIAAGARFIIFAIPFYLLFLFLAPFLYIWWKKKRFSFKTIGIAVVTSVALVAFGLLSLVAAFYVLQGAAFCGIYNC